jgi:hypothetical protein
MNTDAASQALINAALSALKAEVRTRTPSNPVESGWKAYSQCDEDGIIRECLQRISVVSKMSRCFVEIGCGDGLENNSHQLLLEGYRGCWVDADPSNVRRIADGLGGLRFDNRLEVIEARLVRENSAVHFARMATFLGTADIDLFSMDTDGNDLELTRIALEHFHPKLLCVEYNGKLRPPTRLEMAYDGVHTWEGDDFYGASLTAWVDAFPDYLLVSCNLSGVNAFLVRRDVATGFTRHDPEMLYQPPRYWLVDVAAGHRAGYRWLRQVLSSAIG